MFPLKIVIFPLKISFKRFPRLPPPRSGDSPSGLVFTAGLRPCLPRAGKAQDGEDLGPGAEPEPWENAGKT